MENASCQIMVLGPADRWNHVVLASDTKEKDVGCLVGILAQWPRQQLAYLGMAVALVLGMSTEQRAVQVDFEETMRSWENCHPNQLHRNRLLQAEMVTIRDVA